MKLTGKQKRYLRGIASTQSAMFQIGKDGLNDNLIYMVDDALRKHELIKIRILRTVAEDPEELAFDLAMNTKSEVVQIIGHNIVIYRRAKDPQILLP